MLYLKRISVIALTALAFAMPGNASAQDNSQIVHSVQPAQLLTVKSADAAPRAVTKMISSRKTTRRIKRVVVNPVPAQASAEQLQKRHTLEGVFNATNSGENKPTRFIYNRVQDDSQARVLFNESSLNSR